MEIDSKIAVAISPVIILLVHLIKTTVNLPDKYSPALALGIAIIVMSTYVISTTGFSVQHVYDYLVAAVASASVASGIYSWGKTINPPPTVPPNATVNNSIILPPT